MLCEHKGRSVTATALHYPIVVFKKAQNCARAWVLDELIGRDATGIALSTLCVALKRAKRCVRVCWCVGATSVHAVDGQ